MISLSLSLFRSFALALSLLSGKRSVQAEFSLTETNKHLYMCMHFFFNGRDILIYLAATYPNVTIHYTRISFIKKMNEGILDESLSRLTNKPLLLLILYITSDFYIYIYIYILCPP